MPLVVLALLLSPFFLFLSATSLSSSSLTLSLSVSFSLTSLSLSLCFFDQDGDLPIHKASTMDDVNICELLLKIYPEGASTKHKVSAL